MTPPGDRLRIRVYMTTRYDGREHSEGPYPFVDIGSAIKWIATQTRVDILSISVYDGEDLVAEVHA